jgi:hypothetical protein
MYYASLNVVIPLCVINYWSIFNSQDNHLLSVMLITETCFDSTESSSGYRRTVFKVYKVAVYIGDPKGLKQQVLD